MHIKYFHQGLWPHKSPSVTFVTFNALGFHDNDIDFELITTANSKQPIPEILSQQFGIKKKLNIHLLQAGPFKRQHRLLCLMAFFYLWLRPVDVLITRNLTFLPFAFVLRRLKRCRVVFESHDFFTDLSLLPPNIARHRKKQSRQERKYLPRLDLLLCVSTHQKLLYEKYYPSLKIVAAISGIRPSRKFSPPKRYLYTLGYIGSIHDHNYDLELLVRALAKLENKQTRMLFVGAKTEADRTYLADLAEKYDVADRVETMPWLNPAGVDQIKEKIDVGCCPLIYTERNRICTPLKVLEYFSAGIPVIHTDLAATGFIIKNGYNGYLVKESAQEWAAAIKTVYADFNSYKNMSENCFTTARQYSWKQRAKRIKHLFTTKSGL